MSDVTVDAAHRLVYDEEPFQGLGELPAVERVVDEVAPGLGHTPETADGLGRDAGQDLQQGVFREAGHRARASLGAVHATESLDLRSGDLLYNGHSMSSSEEKMIYYIIAFG
jgi:hypothetical protein